MLGGLTPDGIDPTLVDDRVDAVDPDVPTAAGAALPRRHLYAGKGYLPVHRIQFGRGCRYGCAFCAVGAPLEHRHRARPVAEAVAEIDDAGERDWFFVDDNRTGAGSRLAWAARRGERSRCWRSWRWR